MTVTAVNNSPYIDEKTIPNNWVDTLNDFLTDPIKQAVNNGDMNLLDAITEQARIYERIEIGKQQVAQGKIVDVDTVITNIVSSITQQHSIA